MDTSIIQMFRIISCSITVNNRLAFQQAIVIPTVITYSLIFIIGTVGNICTCVVIIRNKSMHTHTNFYLFSLALSDLVVLFLGTSSCGFLRISSDCNGPSSRAADGTAWCARLRLSVPVRRVDLQRTCLSDRVHQLRFDSRHLLVHGGTMAGDLVSIRRVCSLQGVQLEPYPVGDGSRRTIPLGKAGENSATRVGK